MFFIANVEWISSKEMSSSANVVAERFGIAGGRIDGGLNRPSRFNPGKISVGDEKRKAKPNVK